jgi:hypothetical protein
LLSSDSGVVGDIPQASMREEPGKPDRVGRA